MLFLEYSLTWSTFPTLRYHFKTLVTSCWKKAQCTLQTQLQNKENYIVVKFFIFSEKQILEFVIFLNDIWFGNYRNVLFFLKAAGYIPTNTLLHFPNPVQKKKKKNIFKKIITTLRKKFLSYQILPLTLCNF